MQLHMLHTVPLYNYAYSYERSEPHRIPNRRKHFLSPAEMHGDNGRNTFYYLNVVAIETNKRNIIQ